MRLAIDEARAGAAEGNLGVGCVIVRDGAVIGAGRNAVGATGDPTAHAEVVAIRDAARRLGVTRFDGDTLHATLYTTTLYTTTLYTTTEPCPMCLWAIVMTGIGRLVLGARHAAFVRPELGDYTAERMIAMTGAPVEVVTGVLEAECEALRTDLRRRC